MTTIAGRPWIRLELEPGEAQFLGLPITLFLPLGPDNPLPDEPGFSLESLGKGLETAAQHHPDMASSPEVLRFIHRRTRLADLERYLSVGNRTFAEKIAREELRADPEDPPALAALARMAMIEGKFEEALTLYDRVLGRAPSHAQVRVEHAVALAGSGNPGEAIRLLRPLVGHPNLGGTARLWRYELKRGGMAGLADKLQATRGIFPAQISGDDPEAFSRLERLFPDNPEAQYFLAAHPASRLDAAAREATLARVIATASDHVPARVLLTMILRMRGDAEGALEVVEDGLSPRPEDPELLSLRGQIQEQRGLPAPALDDYRRVFEGPLAQIPSRAFLAAAEGILRLASPKEAGQVLDDAAAARPQDPLPHQLRAKLALSEAGLDAAERVLRDAVQAVGPLPVLQYALGDVLRRQGRRSEATGVFQALVKRHPRSPWGYRGLGDVELKSDLGSALGHYGRALERDPWTPIPACDYVRGVTALKDGDPVEAARWLSRAVAGEPDNARTWCDLGAARFHSGLVLAAIHAGTRAAALEPGHPGFAHNLATYHRARFLSNPLRGWTSCGKWWLWRRRARQWRGSTPDWEKDLLRIPVSELPQTGEPGSSPPRS